MPTLIVAERPDTEDATTLIRELDEYLEPLYPQESRHGFRVEQLLREAVAFFVMRHDGMPAGCGGVQLLGTAYCEIKRMYVRPQFRGFQRIPPFGTYKEDPLSMFYEKRLT
jgi:putative acetyltransferase